MDQRVPRRTSPFPRTAQRSGASPGRGSRAQAAIVHALAGEQSADRQEPQLIFAYAVSAPIELVSNQRWEEVDIGRLQQFALAESSVVLDRQVAAHRARGRGSVADHCGACSCAVAGESRMVSLAAFSLRPSGRLVLSRSGAN